MEYTQEQYNRLAKYEQQLFYALHCNFARLTDADALKTLNEVSVEAFNIPIQGNCGHCLMNNLKRLAQPYFQMKEKKAKEEELAKLKEEVKKELKKENNTSKTNGKNQKNSGKSRKTQG